MLVLNASYEPLHVCSVRRAVVLVLNAGDQPYTVDVPLAGMGIAPGTVFTDLLRGGSYLVRSGRIEALSLPARSGALLGTLHG